MRCCGNDEGVSPANGGGAGTVVQATLTVDDEEHSESVRQLDLRSGTDGPGPKVGIGIGRHDRDDRVLGLVLGRIGSSDESLQLGIAQAVGTDGPDRHVEPQIQVTVDGPVDLEAGPFEQDREIGRLLEFQDEEVLPDRMRRAGRDEDGVSGTNRDGSKQVEQGVGILPLHELGPLVVGDGSPGADEHGTARRLALQDDPSLGLAVGAIEMSTREAPSRMNMNRQPLSRVEEFDQDGGGWAMSGHVVGPQPADGVGLDLVPQCGLAKTRQPGCGLSVASDDRTQPFFRSAGAGG